MSFSIKTNTASGSEVSTVSRSLISQNLASNAQPNVKSLTTDYLVLENNNSNIETGPQNDQYDGFPIPDYYGQILKKGDREYVSVGIPESVLTNAPGDWKGNLVRGTIYGYQQPDTAVYDLGNDVKTGTTTIMILGMSGVVANDYVNGKLCLCNNGDLLYEGNPTKQNTYDIKSNTETTGAGATSETTFIIKKKIMTPLYKNTVGSNNFASQFMVFKDVLANCGIAINASGDFKLSSVPSRIWNTGDIIHVGVWGAGNNPDTWAVVTDSQFKSTAASVYVQMIRGTPTGFLTGANTVYYRVAGSVTSSGPFQVLSQTPLRHDTIVGASVYTIDSANINQTYHWLQTKGNGMIRCATGGYVSQYEDWSNIFNSGDTLVLNSTPGVLNDLTTKDGQMGSLVSTRFPMNSLYYTTARVDTSTNFVFGALTRSQKVLATALQAAPNPLVGNIRYYGSIWAHFNFL